MSNPLILAVVGDPVLHSKSPNIFSEVMPAGCLYTRIAAKSAKEAVALFDELDVQGMNVTAPFKRDIIEHLDELDDCAKASGSVNTVVRNGGKLIGYNTDVRGVVDSFLDEGVNLRDRKCLVVGAGGAGRAAVYALKGAGAKVTVVNRTLEVAENVAKELKVDFVPMSEISQAFKDNQIVVMTISADLDGFSGADITPNHIVLDANYRFSKFSQVVRNKRAKLIPGKRWLVNQAAASYEHFFGLRANRTRMFQTVEADSVNFNGRISLIGFMGCGKSTVGEALAKKVGVGFIDTDSEVERVTGKTISDIFKKRGEPQFREYEAEVLDSLDMSGEKIISCGGGAVINRENVSKIRSSSVVIWLYASIDETISRIKDGKRPLLDVYNPKDQARKILMSRLGYYAKACDYVFCVDGKSVDKIVEEIYEQISKTFSSPWKN